MKMSLTKSIPTMILSCVMVFGNLSAVPVFAEETAQYTATVEFSKPVEINENIKFGKVVELSDTEITVELVGGGKGFGRMMGGANGEISEDGERPERPELPEGSERPERTELPEGTEKPERTEGAVKPGRQAISENSELPEGTEKPEMKQDESTAEQVTYTINESVIVNKISEDGTVQITLSEITAEDMVRLELDDDGNVCAIYVMTNMPAKERGDKTGMESTAA